MSATGNATTGSEVIFPADPSTAARLVNLSYQSDSNTAIVSFSTGVGAYSLLATNTSSGVTQVVNSTAGLAANDVLVLQHGGTCYSATLSSTNSGTNAVLASGAWGVAPSIGDSVYKMSAASTVFVGSNGTATAAQNGEAIYVANQGRPLRITLTPALVTNRINSATAHYD